MPKGDRLKLKADPEDGTTPISNLLLEAVAMTKLPGLQTRAILYLWRKTSSPFCPIQATDIYLKFIIQLG